MADLTGRELNGYLLGSRIGSGAMGDVYQAYPDIGDTSKVVAIKVLHREFAKDVAFKARFEREMRLMQALDHPNIVPLLDFGTAQGYLFIAMKLISGTTLSRVIDKRHFSPSTAWIIIKPLAEALAYGHSQGIIHRDVKPGNVLMERAETGDPHLYLMDFGLGKRLGFDTTLTATGISVGTPEYMSPEAALGENIDNRSDIYSLAVMTYELLLGVLPFDFGAAHLTALAQLNDVPPAPCDLNPNFPPLLAAFILRNLSKNPDDRHQSMRDYADAFYEVVTNLSDQEQQADYWIVK